MKINYWKSILFTLGLVFLLNFCVSAQDEGPVKGFGRSSGFSEENSEISGSRGLKDDQNPAEEEEQE